MTQLQSTKAVAVSGILRRVVVIVPSYKTSCVGGCTMNSIGIQVTDVVAPNWTIAWRPECLLPMQHLDSLWTSSILQILLLTGSSFSQKQCHYGTVLTTLHLDRSVVIQTDVDNERLSSFGGMFSFAGLESCATTIPAFTTTWCMWSSSPIDWHIQPRKAHFWWRPHTTYLIVSFKALMMCRFSNSHWWLLWRSCKCVERKRLETWNQIPDPCCNTSCAASASSRPAFDGSLIHQQDTNNSLDTCFLILSLATAVTPRTTLAQGSRDDPVSAQHARLPGPA